MGPNSRLFSDNGSKLEAVPGKFEKVIRIMIRRSISIMRDAFNRPQSDLVYLEGGLGSQILGAISFWNLLEDLGQEKARVNIDYFALTGNPALWKWELEKFGITLESFSPYVRPKWSDKFHTKSDFIRTENLPHYWRESVAKYSHLFPLDSEQIKKMVIETSECELEEDFAAIHIRRGDYLQVASKIITFEEYINLLVKIKEYLPEQVLILTDSKMNSFQKNQINEVIKNNVKRVVFLDNPDFDPHFIHGLMRMATTLVTSNSTFSFTSALLAAGNQITFSPMVFHSGKNSEVYNKGFRATGDFFLWRPIDNVETSKG